MKCDKLFKEAFEGIEFRYKLDDTLEGLGPQKFTAKQLEGYLLGKGVSPKEIKQSGIFEGMLDDNRAFPADMWVEHNWAGKQSINTFNVGPYDLQYDKITLGGKGYDTMSYAETLSTIAKPKNNAPDTPHFRDEISTPKESLLGWRRTHIDEINGKKTLVLNEFQSDWAQTERAGRGTFESNYTITNFSITKPEAIEILKKYETDFFNKKLDLDKSIKSIDEAKDKYWDDWIEYRSTGPSDLVEAENLLTKSNKVVADFPMSEVKHHQFQIVGAINDAIKEGIDTIAIPIQRENELVGSAGVTKFYESLNTKILPDIRKKLEKQGLKIKIDKKPYKGGQQPTSTNDLWTLTIEEVPNGKVKWDVYSVLTALGLGSYTTQSEANTIATEKDIATRQISMETNQKQQAIPEDKLDLASYLSEVPEVVKPSNYQSNYKGIKDYIAKIESRGSSNPYNAKNPNSSAKGKYQFTNIMVKDLNQKRGITREDLKSPKVQEQAMEYLIGKYKEALDKWELPNTKENIFVLHNLGLTGGVKALRGTYEPSDIKNMASNLPADMDKSSMNAVITNYNTLYNVDIPLRSKRISKS